jgi:hypothetical protein
MCVWLQDLPFWKRCLTIGIWGKITLYKYISCWLISEGVCIVAGLTYNGRDSSGKHQWDGCANVKLRVFEGASKFGHFIASFNINTNHWVAQSVILFYCNCRRNGRSLNIVILIVNLQVCTKSRICNQHGYRVLLLFYLIPACFCNADP